MSPSPLVAADDAASDDPYVRGWADLNRLLRRGYSWSGRERHAAFLSTDQGGRFVRAEAVLGLGYPDDGRAAAAFDPDRDGDTDWVVTARSEPRVRILENRGRSQAHWLRLCPVDARGVAVVGARVELWADGQPLVRTVRAGEGYLAQSSPWLAFLGLAASPREVRVRWPGGEVERFGELPDSGYAVLPRGSGKARCWEPPHGDEGEGPGPTPPTHSSWDPSRLVLAAPLPLPRLRVVSPQGKPVDLFGVGPGGAGKGTGKPLILHLWASWCAPCAGELRRLGAAEAELRSLGAAFLAASVDAPKDRETAAAKIAEWGWPLPWAWLEPDSRAVLEGIVGILRDDRRPLSIPISLLVDARGRLQSIRFGSATLEALREDVRLLELDPQERRARALPCPGRWFREPRFEGFEFVERGLAERGLVGAAREYGLAQVEVRASSRADVLRDFGRRAAERGDTEGALRSFLQAVEADPDHFPARFDLAVFLHREGRLEEAVQAYGEALRLRPEDAEVHFDLALAYAALGDLDAAHAELHWLRERDPERAERLEALLEPPR